MRWTKRTSERLSEDNDRRALLSELIAEGGNDPNLRGRELSVVLAFPQELLISVFSGN